MPEAGQHALSLTCQAQELLLGEPSLGSRVTFQCTLARSFLPSPGAKSSGTAMRGSVVYKGFVFKGPSNMTRDRQQTLSVEEYVCSTHSTSSTCSEGLEMTQCRYDGDSH